MALDNAKNFAKATVSTGYDAVAFSVNLQTGHGAKMPTAPFNIVWWNASDYADPSDDPKVEICRVTDVTGDVLTLQNNGIARTAQENTTASTKNIPGKIYRIIAGLTAKTINNDIQSVTYKGVWDASVGHYPTSADKGDYYIVSVAGVISTISYQIGDWIVYNGTTWDKIDNQDKKAVWGLITGSILDQADLVNYISENFIKIDWTNEEAGDPKSLQIDQTEQQETVGTFKFPKEIVDGSDSTDGNPISTVIAGQQPGKVLTTKQELVIGISPVSFKISGDYGYIVYQGPKLLKIYDLTSELPVEVGSIGTVNYPNCVDVDGGYAYVGTTVSGQLRIYNVSAPSTPTLVSSISTENTPALKIVGDYLFVVTSGHLKIYYVGDRSNPTEIGSYTFTTGSGNNTPTCIDVDGNYVYITQTSGYFKIIDITDISTPTLVISLAINSPNAVEIDTATMYAYIPSLNDECLYVYDVNNPASPTLLGSVSTQRVGYPASFPSDVKIQRVFDPDTGNYFVYAYVSTGDSQAVDMYDVTNPASMFLYARGETGGENSNNVDLYNGYVYVVTMTHTKFQVYKLEDGFIPQTGIIAQWKNKSGSVIAYIDGNGNIIGKNLSGTNTGDQDLSGYELHVNLDSDVGGLGYIKTIGTIAKSFIHNIPVSTSKQPLESVSSAVTIVGLKINVLDGTSITARLVEYDTDGITLIRVISEDITATAGTQSVTTSFTNPIVASSKFIAWEVTAVVGAVSKVSVTYLYTK